MTPVSVVTRGSCSLYRVGDPVLDLAVERDSRLRHFATDASRAPAVRLASLLYCNHSLVKLQLPLLEHTCSTLPPPLFAAMAAPHTPPSQPTSLPSPDLNTSPPPAPHEFSSVLHSIQRRTVDRASTDLSSTSWRLKGAPTDHLTVLSDLEADLRLSAQVGVALLEDKASLEKRLAIAEGGNQKLLDRLTSSVKEAAQLQRVSSFSLLNASRLGCFPLATRRSPPRKKQGQQGRDKRKHQIRMGKREKWVRTRVLTTMSLTSSDWKKL